MVSLRGRTIWRRLLLAAVGVSLAACSSSGESGGLPASLDEFAHRFKYNDGELTGWTQKQGDKTLSSYVIDDLYLKIDGPASGYKANGCKYAVYQELVGPDGPDGETCSLVAMEFGTSDQAQSEVDEKVSAASADVTIPGYDEKAVAGESGITSLSIFGHVDWLYFELYMDGYGGKMDQAAQTGAEFIKLLQKKLK